MAQLSFSKKTRKRRFERSHVHEYFSLSKDSNGTERFKCKFCGVLCLSKKSGATRKLAHLLGSRSLGLKTKTSWWERMPETHCIHHWSRSAFCPSDGSQKRVNWNFQTTWYIECEYCSQWWCGCCTTHFVNVDEHIHECALRNKT